MTEKIRYIKKSDILNIPKLKNNPIATILIKKYSVDSKVLIDNLFDALETFMNSDVLNQKLQILFDIYDSDSDGFISSNELYEVLRQLNSNVLEGWKLQNIVDKTFAEIGEYKTKMDFDDFKMIIQKRSTHLLEVFACEE